jgi:alpha-L-fucosidase
MNEFTRRSFVKGAGVAVGVAFAPGAQLNSQEHGAAQGEAKVGKLAYQETTRERRIRWWQDAKFGMFIHWGLYSSIGHQEWVMESEGIPIPQYELLAKHWKPSPNAAREWARLARQAGQKYMVLTAKHHEGFCLWDSKLTDYNAARQGPGRDLVREFVDAARAEGLKVGLYYSLMDWHHPDGMTCATDPLARERFVGYTHGLIRELLTNYGKIDILWYDVDQPLTVEQWRAEEMNRMVFELQPEILVNNRNGLEGDFSTPEHKIEASKRAWETCETMNLGWGWQAHDNEWKSPRHVLNDLTTCAQQGGNYLLNIGPKPDGTVPEESVRVLQGVGRWLEVNGRAIYKTDGGASISFGNYDNFTRRGSTLYIHVYFWPSETPAAAWLEFYRPEVVVAVGGLHAKVLGAKVLKTGQPVQFTQTETTLRLIGLPRTPPDELITVLEIECDRPSVVDHHSIRPVWKRHG